MTGLYFLTDAIKDRVSETAMYAIVMVAFGAAEPEQRRAGSRMRKPSGVTPGRLFSLGLRGRSQREYGSNFYGSSWDGTLMSQANGAGN